METTMNALTLKALLLAEITRLKFGKGFSLTSPKIEKMARHNFAAQTGIKKTSPPSVFISSIKAIYYDNKMNENFDSTLSRFKLDANNF